MAPATWKCLIPILLLLLSLLSCVPSVESTQMEGFFSFYVQVNSIRGLARHWWSTSACWWCGHIFGSDTIIFSPAFVQFYLKVLTDTIYSYRFELIIFFMISRFVSCVNNYNMFLKVTFIYGLNSAQFKDSQAFMNWS